MKKILKFAFIVLVLLPMAAQSETYASPSCPGIEELNRTAQKYSKMQMNMMFSYSAAVDGFSELGITEPFKYEDLRMLQTETDSAVCQKLNEKFDDLDSEFIYDRELRRYMPSWFVLYYEIQDRYVVFKMAYSPGEANGEIGFPSTGFTLVSGYDKKNLNFLGSFSI